MRFDDPTNPVAWLLASVLTLVFVSNAAWLVVRKVAARPAYRHGPLAALAWLALSLFYLLVPFVALQRGVLSPYALGLTEINWPATLSNGMVLAGLIAAGVLFGWLVYRQAAHEADGDVATSEPNRETIMPAALIRLLAVLRAPLDAALQQWHWAFYRATLAGWLALPLGLPGSGLADRILQGLQSQPLYWGAWLGIVIAGLEWVLSPFGRARLSGRRLGRSGEREAAIRRASLGVATTGLFVLTRNFWLCLAVHLVVETLAVGWFPIVTPEAAHAD